MKTDHWLNRFLDNTASPQCLLVDDITPKYKLFEIVQHHGRHERINGRMWDDDTWVYWFDSIKQWVNEDEVTASAHFWHRLAPRTPDYQFGQWVRFKFNHLSGYVIGERKLNDKVTYCVRHELGWFFAYKEDISPITVYEDATPND